MKRGEGRAARFAARMRLAAVVMAASLPVPGQAQQAAQVPALTLAEAVDRALAHHPGVGAARQAAEGAERGADAVAGSNWPSLGLMGTAVSYEERMLVSPIHGFTPGLVPEFSRGLLQGSASLRYTVFDGFGRRARVDAARSEADAASEELDGTVEGLLARVSAAYLEVYTRARVLEAQDRRLAALEAERDRVQRLLEVGRAARVDVLRVEAALAAVAAERVTQSAGLEVAEQNLSRLTGIPVERTRAALVSPVILAADTAVGSREELLRASLGGNAMVVRSRLQAAAAEARVAVARSARWPRLDLAANYASWASVDDDPVAEWNVGVTVSWLLFTGGAVGHEIRRNEAVAAAASERSRLAESDAAEALDRALSGVHEGSARVASLATAVARSEEVARIEQLRLEAGSGTQRDWLDAEAALFANRAALVQAQSGEVMARVELARVTGRLGVDWLRSHLGGTR